MAKKKTALDGQLAEGKKLLDEWGISLARITDQSVSLDEVVGHIGQNPAADVALATLLSDYATPQAAQTLVNWESTAQTKSVRRAISRALYKLSQKGIRVDRPAQEQAKSILTPVEPEGYLSSLDGRGDRLVWLVKPRTGGGLHYLSALVNEPAGMRTVEYTADVTRKGLKFARQDLAARYQISMLEVPWRYCDFVMSEGYERAKAHAQRTGQEEQTGQTEHPNQALDRYPALRSHITTTPAEPTAVPLPDSIAPLAQAIGEKERLLATSAQLFEEPELQRWLLDHEQAHPYVDKLSAAQESVLVLNQYQQQDRAQAVIEEAVADLFSAEGAQAYARRLEETALHLAVSGRLENAKRAVAVALALKQNGQGGKGVPFCEELVRQSIAMHYHEERQQEEEASAGSLIMKPAEFAARMQAARQQRMGR